VKRLEVRDCLVQESPSRKRRQYLVERHRDYRPFAEVTVKEQRAYWNWRHSHPDHDHDGR